MVDVKKVELEKAIKLYKKRIRHHEKHGNGSVAMRDKAQLKIMEHKMQVDWS